MSSSYLNPYEIYSEPRIRKLYEKMWFTGTGIFDFIYRQIRKGNGRYPLDSLLLKAGTKKRQQAQMKRVITGYDLFLVENGMVSLRPGLNTSDFVRRESLHSKVQRAQELTTRDYRDNIFPEESRAMDRAEAVRLEQEVREANLKEVYGG